MNRPLQELDPVWIKNRLKMITFDVDGVIVPRGTFIRENIEGNELNVKTHRLSPAVVDKIKRLKKHIHVNFSSGRALLYLQNMLGDILWERVSIQGENGSFTLLEGQVMQNDEHVNLQYFDTLTRVREELKKLKMKYPDVVRGFEPKQSILTLHAELPIAEVDEIVEKYNAKKRILHCLWTEEAYDIGHKEINKGEGIKFLCKRLGFDPKDTITTGDNVNDKEMLEAGVGVSVRPEKISGYYAIPETKGILGGEVLLDYLLDILEK